MSIAINFHRTGSGPPLVLLHGVGHHWQAWEPVIEQLASEFDVIACDTPGFGRSPPLPAGLIPTIPAYVDAFEWFFAELGLERPHVAGSSMGGGVALELARDRAASSATAFSPIGFWTAAERRYCQLSLALVGMTPRPLRAPMERLARSELGRLLLFSQTFGYPRRLPAEEAASTLRDLWAAPALQTTLQAFEDYSFRSPEQLRSTPVSIAWGNRDWLLPYHLQAPRARALLPWAEHVTLGAGHIPFYDDPAVAAEVIRRCAARVPAAVPAA
ncbi:MAG TPA: alpha/beta hydrolase [Solirubrobacteraceae bacterium]|nr:alpha/beta hydrolase [Solirubrobacteraceae bacterium]